MKNLKFLALSLSLFSISTLSAQETPDIQKVMDLVMSKRFFEAFEYYKKHEIDINTKNSMESKTIYNAFKNVTSNNYDASIPYFNELFQMFPVKERSIIMENLLDFSFHYQKYADVIYLCELLIERLESNEDVENEDIIKYYTQLRYIYSILNDEDHMEIYFRDSTHAIVDFDDKANVPTIEVEVNGKKTKALFDTGVSSPLVMIKQTSDLTNIKHVSDEFTFLFNGIPTLISYGKVDSLKINNLTVYNLDIMIVPINESNLEQKQIDYLRDSDFGVLIGLPLMRELGIVTFDFEEKKIVLTEKDEKAEKDNYNMLMFGGSLYLRASINGISHTGYVDTGSKKDEITINNRLYIDNQDKLGALKTLYTDTSTLISHRATMDLGIFENLKWSLPNQLPIIDVSEHSRIRMDSENQSNYYDSFYGFPFLQRFKKVFLDFNRMEFSYEY